MKSPAATHEWLKRVSDYQSGGASDAERAAVEAHLATCHQCQEAFAMYRRFYSLLRSPLRLGPPSPHFDDDTDFNDATTRPVARANSPQSYPPYESFPSYPPNQSYPPTRPPQRSRRSRALAGVAAVVAATIIVAGFLALYAAHGTRPATTTTPTPHETATVSPTESATATPGADSTPQAGAFICANAPGSSLTYVYRRGDLKLYTVTGCGQPRALPLPAYSYPLAWSPSNRYLAIQAPPSDPNSMGPYPLVIYDTSNGQTLTTKFDAGYPSDASPGTTLRIFIGWVDDNTFLGAVQPVVSGNTTGPLGVSTIVKVNLATQAETTVGKVAWFAATKMVAPNYLFYGGLKNTSEGQAHLHRLDLNTGADTQLVPIGEYGNGGCQVGIFCNWTAWWDVSPDGAHVLYHNPGPTTFPSDTSMVKDTPLVYANVDGTNASRPFGDRLAQTLTAPVFAPDGAYFLADYPPTGNPSNSPQVALAQASGSVTMVNGRYYAWRGDSRALVLGVGDTLHLTVYDLATHTTTTLEPDSMWYLWGH